MCSSLTTPLNARIESVQHRSILVFLKQPTPGRVKTRLAATLGDRAAAAIYDRLVRRVFENLAGADVDEIRVMFDPPDAEEAIRGWLAPLIDKAQLPIAFFTPV